MKKLLVFIILAILPFILVWVAYLLTAFSFNTTEVFQSQMFWLISVVYWFIFTCMLGPLLETN
jgi:hypothetical protein